jgi:hypothetical protein
LLAILEQVDEDVVHVISPFLLTQQPGPGLPPGTFFKTLVKPSW